MPATVTTRLPDAHGFSERRERPIGSLIRMSATADTRAGSSDPAKLTVLYTRSDDGWITAQIAEFPAAISQGRTEHEAWTNVLDALHDLTHEPTASERIAAIVQARLIEPLNSLIERLNERVRGLASRARERGHQHVH